MRAKLLSTARTKARKVQNELVLAQADLHESTSDLANAIDGRREPTRESIAAAVTQNSEVETQLNEAVQELGVVTELLRAADARIEEGGHAAPEGRSGDGRA